MPTDFRKTRLWLNAFGPTKGKDGADRKRLAEVFEKFRSRAETLAGEIPQHLPYFTVHDIKHLDALWEMVDLAAGPDYPLTPAEVFVLGGAILVHDLAMSGAAFQGEFDRLKREPLWRDTVAVLLRKKHDRPATAAEIDAPDTDTEKEATRTLLRELHAKQAEVLPLKEWGTGSTRYHLIDDEDLRETYADIIGLVAHSHHWPVDKLLDRELLPQNPLGAPGGLPAAWTVDPVKLAALLRVADACHCDDRRAPGFLAALRRPSGVSAEHWKFQALFNRPRLDTKKGRLHFSAKRPFTLEELDAWWCGYDWVRGVTDRELRAVDGLLVDTDRPQLQARGVLNADDPTRFATDVRTVGWEPVDARIRVDDVGRLARTLGGEQLYGAGNGTVPLRELIQNAAVDARIRVDDVGRLARALGGEQLYGAGNGTVPLRELIQNAADAVRARRKRPGQARYEGQIVVRLGETDGQEWLEVEDNGVGMSSRVLTGSLLDFGGAFWGTAAMRREFPGLEAEGLEQTGKFGIGFFSAFMWGDRVEVLTRRYDAAVADAKVLEFRAGTTVRPVLRPAGVEERLRLPSSGGTIVRVWGDPGQECWDRFRAVVVDGDEGPVRGSIDDLIVLCGRTAPSLDVHLDTEMAGARCRVVTADDWMTLDTNSFFDRLNGKLGFKRGTPDGIIPDYIDTSLALVRDASGRVLGRATAWGWDYTPILTVGGFAPGREQTNAGLLLGRVVRASRDQAVRLADQPTIEGWAREQSERDHPRIDPALRLKVAKRLAGYNALGSMPIAFCKAGALSIATFREWVLKRRSFDTMIEFLYFQPRAIRPHKLIENEIVTIGELEAWKPHRLNIETCDILLRLVLETTGDAWGVSVSELTNTVRIVSPKRRHPALANRPDWLLTFRRPATRKRARS